MIGFFVAIFVALALGIGMEISKTSKQRCEGREKNFVIIVNWC